MLQIANTILNAYDLGEVKHIDPITVGLIHQTYRIDTIPSGHPQGDAPTRSQFILQRLHPLLGTKEIGEDFLAVTRELEHADFPAPRAILNRDGQILTHENKFAWRMQTFIAGKTFNTVQNATMALTAGELYGKFHKALSDFKYEFKTEVRLHNTKAEFEKLQTAINSAKVDLLEEVKKEVDFISTELPTLYLPDDLPKAVIHGDPKISNILFSEDHRAIALIDLDTCNRDSILVDIGDAFRSWCGKEEDDPNNQFRKEIFDAGWAGYKKGAGDLLTEREINLVPQAIGCITLELAARFLADYFNDNYFGWDSTRYATRRDHNLARCRGQIAEYKDMQDKISR
ncbi:MAG: phosphotransferase [Candidatus Uhrbacteria bacterium]|nr:phosphotransferase [Candidatus Uhrbacteria bacterium]